MRIAIIGAGFSGLCLGIQLKRAGTDSFTILEKGERLGGTWRDNTYPGCACDLMSFAYCFSFEQKTDWSRKWAPHDEILAYMDHCAEKYDLLPHIRFGADVLGASFDADAGIWRIRVARDGEAIEDLEAEVLVSGVGQLHRPVVPKLPGLEGFEGEWFHSARWNHEVELAGKRVGVVGTGASAVQFVPEIARDALRLHVFQRTPSWIIARGDRAYTDAEKARFRHLPWLARLYRWLIWGRQELMFAIMAGKPRASARGRELALSHLRSQVPDPELREKLTPDYPVGGKRILIHDDYYPALCRDNVELVTSRVERIEGAKLLTEDGASRELDVLIFGTGFDTNSFLAPMAIQGLGGRLLEQEWQDGAEAYLGMTVAGFPNLFLMYGPNTNLGHNSIIFMIECQARYILRCLRRIEKRGLHYLDVTPQAMRTFNVELQRELEHTAWADTPHSWYKTEAGRITNNWYGTTTRYWWRTRRPDFGAFRQVLR